MKRFTSNEFVPLETIPHNGEDQQESALSGDRQLKDESDINTVDLDQIDDDLAGALLIQKQTNPETKITLLTEPSEDEGSEFTAESILVIACAFVNYFVGLGTAYASGVFILPSNLHLPSPIAFISKVPSFLPLVPSFVLSFSFSRLLTNAFFFFLCTCVYSF